MKPLTVADLQPPKLTEILDEMDRRARIVPLPQTIGREHDPEDLIQAFASRIDRATDERQAIIVVRITTEGVIEVLDEQILAPYTQPEFPFAPLFEPRLPPRMLLRRSR